MTDTAHTMDPFSAEIDVEVDEWRKATSPQTIGTIGLGPCIGITIYDAGTQVGYVGHFVAEEDADEMIKAATSQCDPKSLKAWVRGGIEETYDGITETSDPRNYVETLLESAGIIDADIQWLDIPYGCVNLILDCQSGEFLSIEKTHRN